MAHHDLTLWAWCGALTGAGLTMLAAAAWIFRERKLWGYVRG